MQLPAASQARAGDASALTGGGPAGPPSYCAGCWLRLQCCVPAGDQDFPWHDAAGGSKPKKPGTQQRMWQGPATGKPTQDTAQVCSCRCMCKGSRRPKARVYYEQSELTSQQRHAGTPLGLLGLGFRTLNPRPTGADLVPGSCTAAAQHGVHPRLTRSRAFPSLRGPASTVPGAAAGAEPAASM